MRRPPVRIAILAVAVLVAALAAMLHLRLETRAEGLQASLMASGSDALVQSRELASIRTSLMSMTAPGQSVASLSERVAKSVQTLRSQRDASGAIDPAAADSITRTLDRLVTVSRRIGDLAQEGQDFIAADTVMSDAWPATEELARGFGTIAARRVDSIRHAMTEARQSQRMLAAAATVVALLAALLLLPGGAATEPASTASIIEDGLDLRRPASPMDDRLDLRRAASSADERFELRRPLSAPAQPQIPAPAASASPAPAELAEAAAICGELARVADAAQLTAILGRAASLLGASGVIVWMADVTGTQLYAAAWHGYDARLFERIGPIRREAANLTAAAFRELTLRSTPAVPGSAAALAVPLPTVDGAVGVLSAELRAELAVVPASTASLATILAAQLATLVTPRERDASSIAPSGV